jgi:glycosyltransferase involved in cell wall biosynthesis
MELEKLKEVKTAMNYKFHILSLKNRGGLEVMFLNYLKHVNIEEHIIFAVNLSDNIKRELNEIGVMYYTYERASKYDLRMLLKILKIIKKYNIKYIYAQNFTGGIWAMIAKKVSTKKLKLIFHEHGTVWSPNFKISLLYCLILNFSDQIIANSKATKIIIEKRFRINPQKVRVIYNGIDFSGVKNSKSSLGQKNNIVFIGRLEKVKGIDIFLNAAELLLRDNKEYKFYIIGEGTFYNVIQDNINNKNLSENIILTGSVNNVFDYLSDTKLLVSPSIRESLGNAIIEACYLNVPVLATKVDGIPEILKDVSNGFLIEPSVKINHNRQFKYSVNVEKGIIEHSKEVSAEELAIKIKEIIEENKIINVDSKEKEFIFNKFNISRYVSEVNEVFY